MSDELCIVVGCDSEPESDPALRFAVEEAALRGLALVVVTVYDLPVDPDLDSFDVPESELQATASAGAEAALRRALDRPTGALPAHRVLASAGDPAHALVEQSSEAVMIVIGRHDRPLLQRLFGRATSRGLLHNSMVPVVIVPASRQASRPH